MVPLRIAVLCLGSLALLGGTRANQAKKLTGIDVTKEVALWFNLLRNGKVDVRLPNLKPVALTTSDAGTFVEEFLEIDPGTVGAETRGIEECVTKKNPSKGLRLKLSTKKDDGTKYAKALEVALKSALPFLMQQNPEGVTGYKDPDANSISFLASKDITAFTCAETTNCTVTFLLCKFKTAADKEPYIQDYVPVSQMSYTAVEGATCAQNDMEFVKAMEARQNAGVRIENLKPEDADKPLTPPSGPKSGVSKSAVSAPVLAALAVTVAGATA